MELYIEELRTPGYVTSGFFVENITRRGAIVECEARDAFPLERLYIEFESDARADAFLRQLKANDARLIIDEDRSLAAAPRELREEYERLSRSGDKKALEELSGDLWEDYGVSPNDSRPRETSGILRLAIMHDDGVAAWRWDDRKPTLHDWMAENGMDTSFDVENFD